MGLSGHQDAAFGPVFAKHKFLDRTPLVKPLNSLTMLALVGFRGGEVGAEERG